MIMTGRNWQKQQSTTVFDGVRPSLRIRAYNFGCSEILHQSTCCPIFIKWNLKRKEILPSDVCSSQNWKIQQSPTELTVFVPLWEYELTISAAPRYYINLLTAQILSNFESFEIIAIYARPNFCKWYQSPEPCMTIIIQQGRIQCHGVWWDTTINNF